MIKNDNHSENWADLNEAAFYDLARSWRDVELEEKLRRLRGIADALITGAETMAAAPHGDSALAASVVYNEIGRVLSWAGDPLGAISAFKIAFVEAQRAGRTDQMYKSLHCQGHCCLDLNDYAEALRLFQLSIEFANFIWPSDMIRTLELVAHCWQHGEATPQLAIGMYDWIILLRPERLDIRIEKNRCLLVCGLDSAVRHDASDSPKSKDYGLIAASIAANTALGQRRSACRRAREGFRIADESKDSVWRNAFETFLRGCSGGRTGA
jgi:hypothetical protein